MSFWTMFWIALIITGLYFALLIIANVLDFMSGIIRCFKRVPASPLRVSIETTEEPASRTRLKTFQSGNVRPKYNIEYVDANGEISERDIYIFNANERYLECWCFKADDRRTFRIDRLLGAVDLSTGQPIHNIHAYWARHH